MATERVMVGSLAPGFDLPATRVRGSSRDRVSLADFRGRWLVLVFYPRDFSLVCPTELTALSNRISEFAQRECDIVGISSDTLESHQRWIDSPRSQGGLGEIRFPLASDADGAVCRGYGVLLKTQHVALRGLFIIDPNGVLQYQVVHNMAVGRRSDEVLRVLDALQTGGLCAENWSMHEPSMDPTAILGPGRVIGHYRVEQQLGAGSFAAVFAAHDTQLDRKVALKVFKRDSRLPPGVVLAEARSAAALNHPNVCTIFAVDDSEGVPVIAMEYLTGKPLAKVLIGGLLPPEIASEYARQIAAGMSAAHEQGIVHGDLKPANVFVTDSGLVKILDFGLSRREQPQSNSDETVVVRAADPDSVSGTPSYMSPEQARGEKLTVESDVFTWGLILYEMLTGRKVFPGSNLFRVLEQVRTFSPEPLLGSVPEAFGGLLREALAVDSRARRLSMQEIVMRLS